MAEAEEYEDKEVSIQLVSPASGEVRGDDGFSPLPVSIQLVSPASGECERSDLATL